LLGYLLLLSAIVYMVMKLRERKLLVKELDMRNGLFSIISHDLRGPVTGNHVLARELLEKIDSLSRVQLKEALAELSASAENASSLLENLLLWSLSQKGMLKPVMREVNLLGVAKEAVGSVRGQDVITIDIPENLIVRTDRNMLLTILRNLLDNAVKASQHSDIPGAPVILRSEATKDLLHARQIVIIDNGPGLREEAPEWGHGLGLVIARELLDKLSARMEMKNRPEGGLQITIDL
jgi:K+-sensing histidine kinase KdpD